MQAIKFPKVKKCYEGVREDGKYLFSFLRLSEYITCFLLVLGDHLPRGRLGFLQKECKREGSERKRRQTPPFSFSLSLKLRQSRVPQSVSTVWSSKSLPAPLPYSDATVEKR